MDTAGPVKDRRHGMTAIDWDALDAAKFADEDAVLASLLASHGLSAADRRRIGRDAAVLVRDIRTSRRRQGVAESFLGEFSLTTREGIALMCLAEALLRTADAETRDRLIAEKIATADWQSHVGQSDSGFVNAATWGLVLTGRLVEADAEAGRDLPGLLKRLTMRLGEPVIRRAVEAAVRIIGEQFVLGRTIEDALDRAAREDLLCSFDMLGEAARTAEDAEYYVALYAAAIERVGQAAQGRGPEAGHGVSVKLSALSPRFEAAQEKRVWAELYPRLKDLALIAARHDVNLAIDAEEADRLVLSLKLIDRLAHEKALGNWQGLGVVVQAYQKRSTQVIAGLAELARASGRQIMVRLVKGAYWDSEIKRAQVASYTFYPVYTSKAATDLSYIACARALLDSAPHLYPQFATHNAHTLAAVRAMAGQAGVAVEYQRLHGMGEALYEAAGLRPRTYAPVGGHEALLPYLVRRLLENGANSSFVHLLMDDDVPVEDLVRDPIAVVEAAPHRNPRLPLPADIYGLARRNSEGRDLNQQAVRDEAARQIALLRQAPPAGVRAAMTADIDAAAARARAAQPRWDAMGGPGRAVVLRAMAEALQREMDRLVALITLEGGKTFNDGVSEVREAIDFCRYYAMLAETQFAAPRLLAGPVGERNHWSLSGRGVFACISPWNFPLAIFTGQIAAALAAGNAVLAKPAEQTPLIARAAAALFHGAGLDPDLLALLPGKGETVGAALVSHAGVDGIAFTGGTQTAAAINRALGQRPGPIIPFIAETGGLNAMVVDTTALSEQVVDDVMLSAFGSAGQRCSALRLLFVPEESADALIARLAGALDALVIGDPADPATDVGPVIDAAAKAALDAHIARLEREARIVARGGGEAGAPGHYVAPVIAEVPAPDYLEREVFGPILHVYRYARGDLDTACARLAARGYGLTLGIHSRIDGFAARIQALVPAGNVYINRSMIGAVVGVQPFGGIGLSGTGPKAGGPLSLLRFAHERSVSVNIMAQGGDPALFGI
jgi:RHH-type proline utilization regulon transcriptional repressor/proline dehydrogenase/delta 1-pyrroline-5-carboxylate dehydrogenase